MTAAMRDWVGPLRETSSAGMHAISTIVVPLDGSEVSKSALPVGRRLALLQGAALHIVYVGEALLGPRDTLDELGLSREELRGLVLDQVTGDPAQAILHLAAELPGSMIVMCTQSSGPEEISLGSVAQAVLAAALSRLVLVTPERRQESWQLRRVLLAHDGSPTADGAIAPTADLAHRAGAEVLALHVAARKEPRPAEPGSLPAPRYVDQPHHEWPAWATEFLERMVALGAPIAAINFKLLVTGGQPGSEIAQFARDNSADMVVLPWRGHWEAQREGAVDVIVRRSGCPVMLICTAATGNGSSG